MIGEYKVNKKCIACIISPIKSRRLHKHHVNWISHGYPLDGDIILLCSGHHKRLHKWIENEAVRFCLSIDKYFFKNKTNIYMKELNRIVKNYKVKE